METGSLKKSKDILYKNLEDVFERCGKRAAHYDANNLFFQDDFEELKEAGYLLMSVPEEHGGYGMKMSETMALTRKLAYHAAPTALGLNMHVYWTGLIADLHRSGDTSLDWVLEEAGRGKVFAAGHGESGNDSPLLYSTCIANKVEGGTNLKDIRCLGVCHLCGIFWAFMVKIIVIPITPWSYMPLCRGVPKIMKSRKLGTMSLV